MTRRFAVVAGARPNFVKVAPILRALDERGAEALLIHTGQHYDATMSGSFFEILGLPEAHTNFGVGSGTHAVQPAAVMTCFEKWLGEHAVDAVIVVGDVNSTLACTLVAAKCGVPVAHVEAGLRAFDRSMPEEVNRVVTDALSTWLFTTSADADANLLAEGAEPSRVHFVGNVMADSLFSVLDRARLRRPWDGLDLPDRFGLVTLHRPALVDDPDRLLDVLAAIGDAGGDLPFIFPVHPRTLATLQSASVDLGTIRLIDPLDYLDFLAVQERAAVVVTDSGGVQEETSLLGTWCVTIRENTERPVTVTLGTNSLVGFDLDQLRLAVTTALARPEPGPADIPLWDGHAAERIAEVLVNGELPRPTFIPPRLRATSGNGLDAMFSS